LALAGITLFLILNLFEGIRDGETLSLMAFLLEILEAAVIFGAVAITASMAIEAKLSREEGINLISKIEQAQFDGSQWRALAESYLDGLGKAIKEQFETWNFTSSEADIAMLMLKGFSHKEIAGLRGTSEATVRQQASSIYQKSKLKNHRELTAYFLEDLTPSLKELSLFKSE